MATKTESIAVKVTPEEKEFIRSLAEREDITISKYIYRILFPRKEGIVEE